MNIAESSNITFTPSILIKNEIIDYGIHLLSFKRKFDFIPGQVIAITSEFTIEPRLYSIASGMNDSILRILFDIKPEGILTNKMAALKPGEFLHLSNPIGSFTCNKESATWIAAGTGIAPYASMFYSGLSENKTLIHGGKSLNSFYFKSDFIRVMGERYIRCCSKEVGDGVHPGRLTDYLKNLTYIEPDQVYYLCGSAEMIVETREILIEQGVPFEKIMAEIYF